MPFIQQMSAHLADLIAAGEVVERPASVVKELMENAIDAGASAVTVEIWGGGMRSIRVSDDGCGIAPSELPTAFLRHATSKLYSEEELSGIGTLGFRGEALAAIASVSHIDIISKMRGESMGAELTLDAGEAGEIEEAGCPEGTTVVVRDLFYNTPARLKFMKKDSAEGSAVALAVQHLALSHPNISIRFIKDGSEQFFTPGDGDLKAAVYSALGRDFAMALTEVSGCGGNVKVEGFVTQPLSCRGTRAMQHFFVNGRYVKSQILVAALEEAYRNRMMKGKFPGCVLHIYVPLDAVDVNVHPAKTIVKFIREKDVFDAVYYTVKDCLEKGHQAPEFKTAADKAEAAPQINRPAMEKAEQNFAAPIVQKNTAQNDIPKITNTPAPQQSITAPERKPCNGSFSYGETGDRFKTSVAPAPTELGRKMQANDVVERPTYEINVPASANISTPEPTVISQPISQPAQQTVMNIGNVESEDNRIADALPPAPWRIAGEVLNTYIIAEDNENETVWLIDKHAAHERVNFDRLKSGLEPVMSQQLLTPLAVTLQSGEYSVIAENFKLLEEFGFESEDFGQDTILVRSAPSDIDGGDVRASIEEIAAELVKCGHANPNGARDAMLHTVACKSAIKAGMHSDEKELRVLVDKVQSGEIKYCPHGRPVAVKLSKTEIEKQFKRIV